MSLDGLQALATLAGVGYAGLGHEALLEKLLLEGHQVE